MDDLIRTFGERGDLAHLALLLWAASASALALFVLRELAASIRRFDDFVRELARFNDTFGGHPGDNFRCWNVRPSRCRCCTRYGSGMRPGSTGLPTSPPC